jgi:hypothetical protein
LSLFSRPVIKNWYESWFRFVQVGTMTRGKSLKVDKIIGRNNFSLSQIKIRALLKEQGLWTPLIKHAQILIPADIVTLEEKAHLRCSMLWKIISSLRLLKRIPLPVYGVS